MDSYLYETLEFDKLLSQLGSFTISPLGDEFIDQITPYTDLMFIQKKLSEVTELKEILTYDDPFPIFGLKDIRQALNKASIQGNFLTPEELTAISNTLSVFRKISEYIKTREEKYPHLYSIITDIFTFKNIEKEINRCINLETNDLFDNASPALARIRKSINASQQKMRKTMENMVTSYSQKNYLQENVITIRDGRLVLMVKDEYRNNVKGIVHDQSATGATLFIEPMQVLELNNQIRALEIEEKREIEKILLYLTGLIHDELDNIQQSLNAAALLDFIYAKAQLSIKINGSQPAINDQNILEIVRGSHPLLILREKDAGTVVPLDLTIGENFNTLIITGPNAGGKTVALKTVGLLSIMTSCGIHIPADPASNIPIFKNIFSLIGDQQSIENDLSTFSSQIEKIKTIIERAEEHDLVIIDEICSGTDPEEGAALAIAVIERLIAINCVTIVTTHLGSLKAFAHETEKVQNGSMEFNTETLQPTYRFRLGMPGSSYAFEIAQRWGLDSLIIDRSRKLVGKEKHRLENLLVDLDKKLTTYQSRLSELSIKQSELNGLIKIYQDKRNELQKTEKHLKQDAVRQAEDIVSSANTLIEQTIKEIKEQQASREVIKAAKERLNSEKVKINSQKAKTEDTTDSKPVTDIKIGQKVKWKSYNKIGTILSNIDASKKVLIDTGDVKIKVPIIELETITQKAEKQRKIRVSYDTSPTISTTEIDLRGLRVDEAIDQTGKFIEEALLAGLNSINIIHGKGTGVLRNSINQFLEKHSHVKNKHLADWNQGGTGVTVVELE